MKIFLVLGGFQILASTARASPQPGLIPGDYCAPRGERIRWTTEAKARTRERVRETVEALGASATIVAYHDLIVCRESWCGEASARHSMGKNEDGLGPHGLSLRWQRGKLGPWAHLADPAFCTPEVSAVVAHEVMWAAVTRYRATNLVEIQAVYGGAVSCREGRCHFTPSASARRGLCARARARGIDCLAPITRADLGRRLTADERLIWALERAREWMARTWGRASNTSDLEDEPVLARQPHRQHGQRETPSDS